MRRQEDKAITDSKEAATKELLPERQATHAERQASATPRREDVSLKSTGTTLYPDWSVKWNSKPVGPDMAKPYQTPREGANGGLTLDKELGADSVFTPCNQAKERKGPQRHRTTVKRQPTFRLLTWLNWACHPRCRP